MSVCDAPVYVCAFAKKTNNKPSAEDNFSIVDAFLRWFPLRRAYHQLISAEDLVTAFFVPLSSIVVCVSGLNVAVCIRLKSARHKIDVWL